MTSLPDTRLLPPSLRNYYAQVSVPRRPWSPTSLVLVLGLDLAVVGVFVAAWYNASTLASPQRQMVWLDLAGSALLVGVAGQTVWVWSGRRAIGRRMRALDLAVAHLPVPDAVPVAGPGPLADAVLVTGAGATLFHLAECPIVRDRDARAMSSADAEARGLRPCGMCAAVAEPVAS